jgi:hypothetical protein
VGAVNSGNPPTQGDIKASLPRRLLFTVARLQAEVKEKQGDAGDQRNPATFHVYNVHSRPGNNQQAGDNGERFEGFHLGNVFIEASCPTDYPITRLSLQKPSLR